MAAAVLVCEDGGAASLEAATRGSCDGEGTAAIGEVARRGPADSRSVIAGQARKTANPGAAAWLVLEPAVGASKAGKASPVACAPAITPAPLLERADGPILVISDLHGNLALLKRALQQGAKLAGREDITAVLIGDYCDNGPEIKALLDFLCDIVLERRGRYGRMTIRPIMGNHDFVCLLALVPEVFGSTGTADHFWERWRRYWNGWRFSTPFSYGCTGTRLSFQHRFPLRHRRLLEALPWYERLDNYIFVHAGLSEWTPVDDQLRFLDAKDVSRLAGSGYNEWKGGQTGMPDQITNKDWARTNCPSWGCIVVTGHNKYRTEEDFVASHRLGLHSCACERTRTRPDLPLHCALLKSGARDLTRPADAPRQFKVY